MKDEDLRDQIVDTFMRNCAQLDAYDREGVDTAPEKDNGPWVRLADVQDMIKSSAANLGQILALDPDDKP